MKNHLGSSPWKMGSKDNPHPAAAVAVLGKLRHRREDCGAGDELRIVLAELMASTGGSRKGHGNMNINYSLFIDSL